MGNIGDKIMEVERDYQIPQKSKKKSVWFWIFLAGLALLVVLGLGSCIMTFSSLFEKVANRKAATEVFLAQVLAGELPAAEDPIYHPQSGITEENLAYVNKLIRTAGEPVEIQEAACSGKTNASTDPINSGTFVFCNTAIQYTKTTGRVEMTWKLLDEEWKILRFYSAYESMPEIAPTEDSTNGQSDSTVTD